MTTEIGLIGLGVIILVFLFILSAIVAGLFFQLQKIQGGNNDGSQLLPQLATLNEKLSHIEPVTQAVSGLQADVQTLGVRLETVEKSQGTVNLGVGALATRNSMRAAIPLFFKPEPAKEGTILAPAMAFLMPLRVSSWVSSPSSRYFSIRASSPSAAASKT